MEAFIHPLPPSGLSARRTGEYDPQKAQKQILLLLKTFFAPLSQGESWLQTETITAPATVPLRQGDEERSDGGGG